MFASRNTRPFSAEIAIGEIVAKVLKPPALIMAEQGRTLARRRRDDLRDRVSALAPLAGKLGNSPEFERDARDLSRQLAEAQKVADAAQRAVREARPPYAKALAAALAKSRAVSAQAIVSACACLRAEIAVQDEIAAALRTVGGDDVDFPPAHLLGELEARAKVFA